MQFVPTPRAGPSCRGGVGFSGARHAPLTLTSPAPSSGGRWQCRSAALLVLTPRAERLLGAWRAGAAPCNARPCLQSVRLPGPRIAETISAYGRTTCRSPSERSTERSCGQRRWRSIIPPLGSRASDRPQCPRVFLCGRCRWRIRDCCRCRSRSRCDRSPYCLRSLVGEIAPICR